MPHILFQLYLKLFCVVYLSIVGMVQTKEQYMFLNELVREYSARSLYVWHPGSCRRLPVCEEELGLLDGVFMYLYVWNIENLFNERILALDKSKNSPLLQNATCCHQQSKPADSWPVFKKKKQQNVPSGYTSPPSLSSSPQSSVFYIHPLLSRTALLVLFLAWFLSSFVSSRRRFLRRFVWVSVWR